MATKGVVMFKARGGTVQLDFSLFFFWIHFPGADHIDGQPPTMQMRRAKSSLELE